MLQQTIAEAQRGLSQALGVAGGERQQPWAGDVFGHIRGHGSRRVFRHACGHAFGRFLDDQVGVGSSGSEGGEGGDAGSIRRGPFGQFALHPEGRLFEDDVRVELAGVERGRELPMAHLQEHLGESGDAGGGLRVADVGLDRADGAVLPVVGVGGIGFGEAGDLDRVSQRGSRAVGLDIADLPGVDAGPFEGFRDQPRLGEGIGDGVAVGLAAVVEAGGADDAMDVIAVAERLGERLEQRASDAFAGDDAVAARAEALAASVAGEEVALGQGDVLVGMDGEVDAAGQGHGALAAAEAFAGQMQGGERGGALRVHGQARPFEVADPGDAVGDAGGAS